MRFQVVMGLGRTLVAVGWPAGASRVYGVEIARVERQVRVMDGRRG